MAVTYNELRKKLKLTPRQACRVLDVISGVLDPKKPGSEAKIPEARAWWEKATHRPVRYERQEAAIGDILDKEFGVVDIESTPWSSHQGIKIGTFVGSFANVGDPYVTTLVYSYRDLDMPPTFCDLSRCYFKDGGWYKRGEDGKFWPWDGPEEYAFEEGEWYVCCWADLLEAAEFTYRSEDEEADEEEDEGADEGEDEDEDAG